MRRRILVGSSRDEQVCWRSNSRPHGHRQGRAANDRTRLHDDAVEAAPGAERRRVLPSISARSPEETCNSPEREVAHMDGSLDLPSQVRGRGLGRECRQQVVVKLVDCALIRSEGMRSPAFSPTAVANPNYRERWICSALQDRSGKPQPVQKCNRT
jgi:hypothetical protein